MKFNGELINVNECVAVQTLDSQTRETAETARVLALWIDSKGINKGAPYFKGRWLFEPKHLSRSHPERTRTRSEEEKKELFEGIDIEACDDNELVRCDNLIIALFCI